MAQYEWSEIFFSIEGEGPYSGNPTVYIRFARCNFKCPHFNNKLKIVEKDGYATLMDPVGTVFEPKNYTTLESIPLIHHGCDSQYSVNPKFSHMWHKGDENALAAEVLKILPNNSFTYPDTNKSIILSLTGGEPTLRLKFWVPILEQLYKHGMRKVLIETNCASPLRSKDIEGLYQWAWDKYANAMKSITSWNDNPVVDFIWSNSPKLSSSGETWKNAIRPEIALAQRNPLPPSAPRDIPGCEQYFKFVCGPNEEDFAEVKKAMEEYYAAGISKWVDVYVMPTACTEEQQQEVASQVAKMCMEHGYIYCHRIQNSVWGNGVGT